MPDVGQRDRTPFLTELTETPWPAPPLNVFLRGHGRGVIDIRWDDPAILSLNSKFELLGVNIYRSFDSEYGPFTRVTDLPIGTRFWRDVNDNELVEEDVTDQFEMFGIDNSSSGSEAPRYVFRTRHCPIVHEGGGRVPTRDTRAVRVFVDGVEARVQNVNGNTGEVEIDANTYTEVGTQKTIPPILPTPTSRVVCYYRYTRSWLKTDLGTRVFYRITTVGVKRPCNLAIATPGDLVETPLEHGASTNLFEVEKLEYIWREAIRRNRWILQQGGERVQVFLRKTVGVVCGCYVSTHKQGQNDCTTCYGTSIVGGYEGPFDMIIGPDDAERRIAQKEYGRTKEHTYEVFGGPSPLLAQRDFLMKVTGDRFSIGPPRMPTNRGNILQQHFTIASIDEKDIRYKVPIDVGYRSGMVVRTGPEVEASSEITEKENISDEREYKGRTLAWKNSVY